MRIGRIGRPHGLGGEVALDGASLDADELMKVRTFLWKGRDEERTLKLLRVRDALPRPLLRFDGIASRESA